MSEAIGKILGMVMAYGVSSLGLFLAYVNYRKRIVGADKVMTGRAWTVIAIVAVAVAAGAAVVSQLAEIPVESGVEETVESPVLPSTEAAEAGTPVSPGEDRDRWPWIGIVIPASIFLFATWVTAALHRHFATHGHGGDPSQDLESGS